MTADKAPGQHGLRRGSRFGRQFASLTFSNAISAGLSFLTLAVVARELDIQVFGQVVFAQAIAGVLFALADPRIDQVVIRYAPIAERVSGRGSASWLFERGLRMDALIGVGVAAAAILIVTLAPLDLGGPLDPTLLALALAQYGFQAAAGTGVSGWAITDALAPLGLLQSAINVVTSLLALAMVLKAGAIGYLAALAAGAAVMTAIVSVGAVRRVRRRYGAPAPFAIRSLPGVGDFTLKSSLAASAEAGIDQLPAALIGSIAGAGTLAQFRIAQSPGRLVALAYSPYAIIVLSPFSEDAARGRLDEVRRRAIAWTRRSMPLVLVAAGGAWLTLPFLVPLLFGAKYEPAVTAACLLTTAALVRATTAWAKVLALAVGRPGVRLAVVTIDGILLLASAVVAAPHGTTAIAAAYLAVASVVTGAWIVLALRLTQAGRTAG